MSRTCLTASGAFIYMNKNIIPIFPVKNMRNNFVIMSNMIDMLTNICYTDHEVRLWQKISD